MKKFITEVILVSGDDPQIFSEGAVRIRLEDEAAGHFLKIDMVDGTPVRLDFSELDAVFTACKELDNQ